jgi:hypothetical protein
LIDSIAKMSISDVSSVLSSSFRLGRPRTASTVSMSSITLPRSVQTTQQSQTSQVVFIKVDELDEKPRLLRRLSDPTPRKFLHICDNTDCSTVDSEMKLCGGCKYNRYCSSACQQQDWWNHKDVCSHTCVGCRKIFKEFAKTEKVKYNGKKWYWNFCNDCELLQKI